LFSNNTKTSSTLVSFNIINKEFLPKSKDPKSHLKGMGFSEEEINILMVDIGNLAFARPDIYYSYGEFFDREAQLKIMFNEPSLIFTTIWDSSESLFEPLDYGNFVREDGYAQREVVESNWFMRNIRGGIYSSNLIFFIFILFSTSIFSIIRVIRNKDLYKGYLNLVVLFLIISCSLLFITTIFGDANHELIKHLFLVNIIFDIVFFIFVYNFVALSIFIYKKVKAKGLKDFLSRPLFKIKKTSKRFSNITQKREAFLK
jgi:hypothetical protein